MKEITLFLEAASRGDQAAAEELLPLVYDELRTQASLQMSREAAGQTLQPTALVHEAWLRLVKVEGRTWRNREHFFRAAALAMRRILVDRARNKLCLKRGGGAEKVSLDDVDADNNVASVTMDERVLLVDQSLEQLEKEDPESARVISLKFFGGMTNKEVASILGVTERSVERHWAYAKARLFKLMKAQA